MIDDALNWKCHIAFICSRLSRNTGIISKLRHYLSLKQLRQLYYNLIYPYLSYAIIAWGSTYKTHLKKIQTKQNHVIRLIFFANSYGKETESAKPLLNILNILNVDNIYRLHIFQFTHLWHCGALPNIFNHMFEYASNVHRYNTRYASKQNFYKGKARTNIGKQTISFMACDLWSELPVHLKCQNPSSFKKKLKEHLLSTQYL